MLSQISNEGFWVFRLVYDAIIRNPEHREDKRAFVGVCTCQGKSRLKLVYLACLRTPLRYQASTMRYSVLSHIRQWFGLEKREKGGSVKSAGALIDH